MRKKCYIYTRVSTAAQTEGYSLEAQSEREKEEDGGRFVKTHSLEHEHILTGLIRCPLCGGGMSGTVQRRQNKKTGEYKDTFYYRYHHRKKSMERFVIISRC